MSHSRFSTAFNNSLESTAASFWPAVRLGTLPARISISMLSSSPSSCHWSMLGPPPGWRAQLTAMASLLAWEQSGSSTLQAPAPAAMCLQICSTSSTTARSVNTVQCLGRFEGWSRLLGDPDQQARQICTRSVDVSMLAGSLSSVHNLPLAAVCTAHAVLCSDSLQRHLLVFLSYRRFSTASSSSYMCPLTLPAISLTSRRPSRTFRTQSCES